MFQNNMHFDTENALPTDKLKKLKQEQWSKITVIF